MLVPLNLPQAPLKLTRKKDQIYVHCLVRRKSIVCTPEEWVRQHVIYFLVHTYGMSTGLMTTEHRLNYNGREKRADLVVFGDDGRIRLLVECKAPSVSIDNEVVFQIAQYQHIIQSPLLLLSNGLDTMLFKVNESGLEHIAFPETLV